jgi:hypothetical protein
VGGTTVLPPGSANTPGQRPRVSPRRDSTRNVGLTGNLLLFSLGRGFSERRRAEAVHEGSARSAPSDCEEQGVLSRLPGRAAHLVEKTGRY